MYRRIEKDLNDLLLVSAFIPEVDFSFSWFGFSEVLKHVKLIYHKLSCENIQNDCANYNSEH